MRKQRRLADAQKGHGSVLFQTGMQACAGATDPVHNLGMLAVECGPDIHSGSKGTWKGWDGPQSASPDQVSLASDI